MGYVMYRDRVVDTISKHPFLSAALVCLITHLFTFGADWNIPDNAVWFSCGFIFLIVLYLWHKRCLKKNTKRIVFYAGLGVTGIVLLISSKLYQISENRALWHLFGGFFLVIVIGYILYRKTDHYKIMSFVVIGMGMVFRLYYCLRLSCFDRQHDVGSFDSNGIGHFSYVTYLIEHKALPDYDVRPFAQFFHPPLYHTICAVWIDLNEKVMGVDYNSSRESLHSLSLFFSLCIIVVIYKIMRHLKINGKGMMFTLCLVSFHPAMIMHSASLNNDQLTTLFILSAVYNTLLWYENKTLKNIMKISLCIGLGMMTKLSAAVIAVPVGIVFIVVLLLNIRKKWKMLIGQYLAFGVVCVPLGLWFQIRNLIKWGIPINYMWAMKPDNPMYLGDRLFTERITDFSLYQFKIPFEQFLERGDDYAEFNPLVAILKNFIFGEYVDEYSFNAFQSAQKIAYVLFYTGILLALLVFIAAVIVLILERKTSVFAKIFLAGTYLSSLACFYWMCYSEPYVCTMNSRYLIHVLVISFVFFGIFISWMSNWKTKASMIIRIVLAILITLFSAMSMILIIAISSSSPVYASVIIPLIGGTGFVLVEIYKLCKNKTEKPTGEQQCLKPNAN